MRGWGGGGGWWVKPPRRHVRPSCRPKKTAHEPHCPSEGPGGGQRRLQNNTALLVLPTGPGVSVLDSRGSTGPKAAVWKSRPGRLWPFCHCVWIVYGFSYTTDQ